MEKPRHGKERIGDALARMSKDRQRFGKDLTGVAKRGIAAAKRGTEMP